MMDAGSHPVAGPGTEPVGKRDVELVVEPSVSVEEARERRREAILSHIPDWYSPKLHLAVPTLVCLSLMVAAISLLRDLRPVELLTIPITIFVGFGFEWRAHKYVLHTRQPLLEIIYDRHELMHHIIYTYDNMAMRSPRELWLILMPAYAAVLVFAMILPIAVLVSWLFGWNIGLLVVISSMAFFLSYEWLHMAYHLPADSAVGRLRIITFLRQQHRRHHDPRLMKRWNFNVTVPVFDAILGTLWSPAQEAAREGKRRRRRNGGPLASGASVASDRS